MGPGEPGFVPERGHSCVHERMEPAKSEGFSWELNRTLKRCSWTMTCAGPGSRVKGAHTKEKEGGVKDQSRR